MMKLLSVLAGVAALIGAAGGDRTPLIAQALDQTTRFQVENAPVIEAFEALTGETGVRTTITPEVVDLLPYGSDTRISVEFENISLREGMTQFLRPLGLTFEVTDEGVRVLPKPELLRIGYRATWAELDDIAFVREIDWAAAVNDPAALRDRFQMRVTGTAAWKQLTTTAAQIGAGPGDEVLTLACESFGWTWVPEGDKVVILSTADQIRRLLEGPLSLRVTHRPLVEVLQQLARKAHVTIRHEPGVLASLPVQTSRSFSLLAEGITAGEALEQIAAATGLGYRIDSDAVVFYHPGSLVGAPRASEAAKAFARDPYVAKVALPAEPGQVQVEILVRQSEFSPEALEARRQLVQEADEILRLELDRMRRSDPATPAPKGEGAG